MTHCDYCGTRILFGGKKDNGVRYCNERCQNCGRAIQWSHHLPEDFVQQQVLQAHQGECPTCSGPGPIDVHTSYSVWSAVYLTRWVSTPHVCCKSCGLKFCLKDGLFSVVFGWWGFPFGFIITPIQVYRNVASANWRSPDPWKASPMLERLVRVGLGRRVAQQQQSTSA
jgi:hypothetical protein